MAPKEWQRAKLPQFWRKLILTFLLYQLQGQHFSVKAAYSVTMNIVRKKKYFLFKSFAKVE